MCYTYRLTPNSYTQTSKKQYKTHRNTPNLQQVNHTNEIPFSIESSILLGTQWPFTRTSSIIVVYKGFYRHNPSSTPRSVAIFSSALNPSLPRLQKRQLQTFLFCRTQWTNL